MDAKGKAHGAEGIEHCAKGIELMAWCNDLKSAKVTINPN